MKVKVILILVLLPVLAWGITLEEAEKMTLENNKDLITARQEKEGSYANYKSVKGSIFPQVNLSGSYGVKKTDIPKVIPPGVMAEKELPLNTVLSMQQILFSSDVFNGLKAAKVYTDINNTNLKIVENNVLFQTRRLFYSALLAKEVLDIQRDAVNIANAHYERVKDMYEQGVVSEYDELRAKLQVKELLPEVERAKNNFLLAKIALQNQIGSEIEIDKVEGTFNITDFVKFNLDEAITEGLNNRLELQASKLNSDILEIQYKNQQKSYLPTLALNASLTNFTYTNDYDVESDNFGNIYEASLNFSVPIFTGFTNKNTEKKYKYEWLNAETADSKLRDSIKLEITSHFYGLQKNIVSLVTAEENISLAQRALTIAQERYNNQLGTYLDVETAQLSYKQANLNYKVIVHDLIDSYESLLKSVGREF